MEEFDAAFSDAEEVLGQIDPRMTGLRLEERRQRILEPLVADEHHAPHAAQNLLRERLPHDRIGHLAEHLQFARIVEGQSAHVFGLRERIAGPVAIEHAHLLPQRIVALLGEDEITRDLAVIEQALVGTLLEAVPVEIGQVEAQNQDGGEDQQHPNDFGCHRIPLLKR